MSKDTENSNRENQEKVVLIFNRKDSFEFRMWVKFFMARFYSEVILKLRPLLRTMYFSWSIIYLPWWW